MKLLHSIIFIWISVQRITADKVDKDKRFFEFEECLANSQKNISEKLFGSHQSNRDSVRNYNHLNIRFNDRFPKVYPIAIFLPTSTEDVQTAVKCGVKTKIQLIPISGGHSYAGLSYGSNDAITIDFRDMKNISINHEEKIVSVDSGTILGDLYTELKTKGLGAPIGSCANVAMGGLALGGGTGYFAAVYGLLIDNLVEIEMVDARGRAITVNQNLNTDLWWALRGVGPGYIGIVTSVKLKVFETKDLKLTSFMLRFHNHSFKDVMKSYYKWLDWVKKHDPEINSVITVRHDDYKTPETIPRPDGSGIELLIHQIKDAKTPRNQDFICAALKIFPEPFETNLTLPTFYGFSEWLKYDPRKDTTNTTEQIFHYHLAKSFYVKKPYDAKIFEEAQQKLFEMPDKQSGALLITSEQGAVGRIQSNASAYVHRDALFNFKVFYETDRKESRNESEIWMNDFHETISDLDSGRTYQNYPEKNLTDYLRRYYGSNLERLVEIKKKWDPDYYFRSEESLPIDLKDLE